MSVETLEVDAPLPAARGPWGPFASIGITLLVLVAHLLAALLTAVVMTVVARFLDDSGSFIDSMPINGLFISLSTVLSCIASLALVAAFIVLRDGPPIREYLALRPPRAIQTIAWVFGFFLYLVAADLATSALRTEELPDFMIDVYKTAGSVPFLVFALAVAAPLSEEIVFRGFMFAGLRQSRLGAVGAILLSSALFASLHVQYDLSGILIVFSVGLFLGFVRERTGSLPLCMVLHSLMNLVATLQVASVVENS